MKLGPKDAVEQVYFTRNGVDTVTQYKGKQLVLNSIKLGKRDGKGTKIRVSN